MAEKIKVAVAGNPNVGKTTIFNALTGARQKVGNWPGVTVEKKEGTKKHKDHILEIVDLPGTYSLTAYSADEVVARDYILEEKPDVVVQVLDSTNLERNLYLTSQLLEMGTNLVLALNMSDRAETRGDDIDIRRLESLLGVSAIKTAANEGRGINALLDSIVNKTESNPPLPHEIGYGGRVEENICALEEILGSDRELSKNYPSRWMAVKLLEGDENALSKLSSSSIEGKVQNFLSDLDHEEYEVEMADKRYEFIGTLLPQVCTTCAEDVSPSDMVDKVITNKYLGIPIFLTLMWGMFELTFAFATPSMELIDMFFGWLAAAVTSNIETVWLASLLGDGIVAGVGSVLLFVPNIFILFFVIALLESSGYMARAAFIMDRLMYTMGLQGKSFIPMLTGFGCSVPAIMATRTLEDEKDRLITMLVTPFMSCGARLPVYILLAGTFFSRQAGSVIFGLYVLGILVAIVSAKLFRTFIAKGQPSPFIMELPPYTRPSLKDSLQHMWNQGYLYLRKVGTIIVGGVVLIWLLAYFPQGADYGSADSLIGSLGKLIEPLVAPLGFDWKIAVALVFGFVAKEIVVGSLGTLYGTGEGEALSSALVADPGFTPAIALGLMVFTLLYVPCIGAVAVIKKETGSWKWMFFQAAYSTAVAWILALVTIGVGNIVL
ncbi:ferrous iron transport protein B [Methanohalophilus euhalobius]|uniref:Ferrous iron transport protein B n=1 Tax=Methanohalophilus euhalobius TaxID=51203 RepID=A0A315BA43_9EURY|nr:ferrous iron transport protein B [Methanohalophilus euhalobius]PQV43116.1 ferrous iron transport protein B [Methanohalophilus euhalobius]RNI09319.1 ferrous iron transport protein B [Methanohalophilus euhalobius]